MVKRQKETHSNVNAAIHWIVVSRDGSCVVPLPSWPVVAPAGIPNFVKKALQAFGSIYSTKNAIKVTCGPTSKRPLYNEQLTDYY